ncbi:hypothetical protein GGR51DRAFT_526991 [Nemania sp. FL0031]|nr:hypothetical protein GGR51DRAFT_526991 [Nemania sp. FL0031]
MLSFVYMELKSLTVSQQCIFTGYSYCLYHWINLTGMYVHAWDVRLRTAFDFAYIVYVGENLYGSTLMTLKIGVLLEWARIFVPTGTRNSFWWLCNATLVANVLFYVAVKLVDNLACFPHEKIWDLTVEGHCINQRASALASAIVNLVSDLVILGLPQMVIWKLNMSFAKRLGVSCIFAVGVFCCVAAIFRVITSYQYYKSIDQVYDLSPVALWDVVEMTLVIVIACLPSIPVIFKDPRIRSLWPLMKSPASSLGKANSSTKLTSHGTVDSSNRNAYQQLEEHSLSTLTANMHGNDLIVKSYGAAAQLSEPTHDQAQMSITLTKSFTTQIDQGDGIAFPSNHDFHIHHPWAKEGV